MAIFDRVAQLLELQRANPFRIAGWKHGAEVVRKLTEPLAAVAAAEGEEGIKRVTGLGPSLVSALREVCLTGHLSMLHRLEGAVSVEEGLMRVPGVGPTLAARAHRELGVESLEDFEAAAHDGRLAKLPHVGPRRLEMVQRELATMLSRSTRRRMRQVDDQGRPVEPTKLLPAVDTLLAVDEQYRRAAAQDALPKIAPRRFNPTHDRWLPILHTEAAGWAFTVLFSNTARAHQRQATHDWVVLYFERDGHEGQCTVVTELRGPLAAHRVVRGRERECAQVYAAQGTLAPAGDDRAGPGHPRLPAPEGAHHHSH